MTTAETAWLAGLLEGEGCFFLASGNSLGIRLKMADEDVVRRAHVLMNGQLREATVRKDYPHWTPLWSAEVYGKKALIVMKRVLPLMGRRRTQKIREIIQQNIANKKASRLRRKTIFAAQMRMYWADPVNREAQSQRLKRAYNDDPVLRAKGRANCAKALRVRWDRAKQQQSLQ